MKNMFRLITAAAMLALAVPAYAQGGGGGGMGRMMSPEQRMAQQKEALFKGITLDAGQTAKVDSIFQDATKKQQEFMQSGGMEAMRSPEGREKIQKFTSDRNAAIKAVLSAEQQKTFEENLANQPQMGRRPGGI